VIIPAGSSIKLNSVLPGGVTPTALLSGDCNINNPCFDAYLDQGKINNVLLSQTIALSLNVRLNGGSLATLRLGSGCINTSGGSFQINQSVITYLGSGATVKSLLDLANAVLGGTLIAGTGGVPSLSAINDAVDAINNGFDECRTFLGYCTPGGITLGGITISAGPYPEVSVTAYPNPFSERISFVVSSQISGMGSLELYNIAGQKVKTVYQGLISRGTQTFEYTVPVDNRSTLIYKMTVKGQQVTGKILNIKN
jgi:hypothetical protein